MIKIAIVILVIIGCAAFLQFERKAIRVTYYEIDNPKIPRSFDGIKVLHVSDLQSEYFGKEQRNILSRAKAIEPDFIVITGDLADRNHTDIKASLCAAKGLAEIADTYYVNGNHEMRLSEENRNELYAGLQQLGVSMLLGEGTLIYKGDECIGLCGMAEDVVYASKEEYHEHFSETDTRQIQEAAEKLSHGSWRDITVGNGEFFQILLTHEPQYVDIYDKPEFDLIFAGHAHGGQVRLPFIKGVFSPGQGFWPKYTAGVYQKQWSKMVVSRGLGNSTCPIRVFNRPELVVVTLKKSGDK